MNEPGLSEWKAVTPRDAALWLERAQARWWIAGGWALDLHLGRPTRRHADIDAGCFRDAFGTLRAALDGWALYEAKDGTLARLAPGEAPGADVHSVWCRPENAREWWLELMLDDREGDDWVFRRCPEVRLPQRDLVLEGPDSIPYIRPEVQLLYKAKGRRPRDEADLGALLPALDGRARLWLRDALRTWDPQNPWLAMPELGR